MGSRGSLIIVGASLLGLASVIIGAVPIIFTAQLAAIGGAFPILGIGFGLAVGGCGVVTFLRPQYAAFAGIAGILFSLLSLIGAMGGLIVGMLLGLLGGSLSTAGGIIHRRTARDSSD